MQARTLYLLPLLLSSLCFVSCTQNAPKDYSTLNGNWHLAGEQGTTPGPLLQSPLLTFAMGVDGNTVYANGNVGVTCSGGSSGIGGGMSLAGQIAPDGTFVLSNSSAPADTIQLTIKGKVPAHGESTWAGSYTMANATPPTGCTFSNASNFTATAYPPLNGTYSGAITGPKLGAGITVTTEIFQGEFTSEPSPSSLATYFTPLSATITVNGSSTLTSGTTTSSQLTAGSSSIRGNSFVLHFLMNDGSTMYLDGWFTDSSESTLQVTLTPAFGTGGTPSNICTLTRQ